MTSRHYPLCLRLSLSLVRDPRNSPGQIISKRRRGEEACLSMSQNAKRPLPVSAQGRTERVSVCPRFLSPAPGCGAFHATAAKPGVGNARWTRTQSLAACSPAGGRQNGDHTQCCAGSRLDHPHGQTSKDVSHAGKCCRSFSTMSRSCWRHLTRLFLHQQCDHQKGEQVLSVLENKAVWPWPVPLSG